MAELYRICDSLLTPPATYTLFCMYAFLAIVVRDQILILIIPMTFVFFIFKIDYISETYMSHSGFLFGHTFHHCS